MVDDIVLSAGYKQKKSGEQNLCHLKEKIRNGVRDRVKTWAGPTGKRQQENITMCGSGSVGCTYRLCLFD